MEIGRFPFNGNVKESSAQHILPIRRLRRRTPRPGATNQNHQSDNRSQQKSANKKQPATLHNLRSEHYLAFRSRTLVPFFLVLRYECIAISVHSTNASISSRERRLVFFAA